MSQPASDEPTLQSVVSDVNQAVIDTRERLNDELRKHSIHIMRMNEVRSQQKTAPPEVIAQRAQALREHEQLCNTLLGEHVEAWMAAYTLYGIPAEDAAGTEVTNPQQWVRPNVRLQ